MIKRMIAKKDVKKGDAVIIGDNTHSFQVHLAPWVESCDHCRFQEGRHYCLLHSTQMRDMNVIRCDDWKERA